jgi:hypothetical protein
LINDLESAAGSLTVGDLEAGSTGRDGDTVGLSTDAIVRIWVLKTGRGAAKIARALRALVRRAAMMEEWKGRTSNWYREV